MVTNRRAKLRGPRAATESGFTLIELLVVVVIIGILIAIAIPVYLNYQKGAKDKSADSDLRNAVAVLELCNSDNGTYPAAFTPVGATPVTGYTLSACSQTIKVTAGTTMSYTATTGVPNSFVLTGSNSGGKPTTYCYDSAVGGPIRSVATC